MTELRNPGWEKRTRQCLNEFFRMYGNKSAGGGQKPYVVFDFDNTTAVFDVEHALCIYQLLVMAFAMTPERLGQVIALKAPREDYSDWVSDIVAAYRVLWEKYGPFDGEELSQEKQKLLHDDPWWLEFAVKLRAMYREVNRGEGALAGCLFPLFWFTGMSGEQLYRLAAASHRYFEQQDSAWIRWTSPAQIASRLGQRSYTWMRGVSVTPQLRELWKALSENGFDIWVCSASGTVPVQAAIDVFGLRPYCTGMTGMNLKRDEYGLVTDEYDHAGGWYLKSGDGWLRDDSALYDLPQLAGKTAVIRDGLVRRYGCGPIAGFGDSAGDFYFCTEFSSLKLVLFFNRACFGQDDPGLLPGYLSLIQRRRHETLASAAEKGDTLYLLQGRDEAGRRSLRAGMKTRRVGSLLPRLFGDRASYRRLKSMKKSGLPMPELIRTGLPPEAAADYRGYHSL